MSVSAAPPRSPRVRRGGIAVFLVVAFGVTWALWLPLAVRAMTTGLDRMPWTFFAASAGPLCGAVAASVWSGGRPGLSAWARRAFAVRRLGPRLLGVAAMLALYLGAGWAAQVIATGAWPDPTAFGVTAKLPELTWPVVALVWLLTFGLGEETGWRGWLLPALCTRLSPLWSALLVGGVWIAWHAPAFLFNPTYTAMGAGVIGWGIALLCGSLLLSWMTRGAGGGIVPVLVWHAGFDLLTAADQSAGAIAATISAIVMVQGAWAGVLLWRRGRP